MDFIIKGTICYSTGKKEIRTLDGYAVCLDGVSAGVFSTLPERFSGLPLIDRTGCLVIPGMVDLHIHASQFAYRGTGFDLELLDWLTAHAFPEESRFADTDYAAEAYSIFADAMKKSATTRAAIFASRHAPATEILMEKCEESGIVSYVGKVNMDRSAPSPLCEESAEASAKATVDWIERVSGRFSRTYPIITPRFIPSCSDELMRMLGGISAKYHTPVQSHLSENHDEIELVRTLRPDSDFYGDAYDRDGLFGRTADGESIPTLMSHCVWSTDAELQLMKKNGVFIVHCPASNLNVASGIAPISKYLGMGLRVGLGTDVAGGQSESMFRAVTDAVQLSKMYMRHVDSSIRPLTFEEGFFMATLGGGEFFGKVGSFEEGYEFDALVIDDRGIASTAGLDERLRLERAFYLSLDSSCITDKYARGRKII